MAMPTGFLANIPIPFMMMINNGLLQIQAPAPMRARLPALGQEHTFVVQWGKRQRRGVHMSNYLGIIIQQCLRDPVIVSEFPIVSVRRPRSWVFLLASVPEEQFERHVALLQANMVTDDHWYAHYFRGDELVVVFRDGVFHVSTDPASWGPAVAHGLARGIPAEQLDFTPRTQEGAEEFFRQV